jgi:hypothetical protein
MFRLVFASTNVDDLYQGKTEALQLVEFGPSDVRPRTRTNRSERRWISQCWQVESRVRAIRHYWVAGRAPRAGLDEVKQGLDRLEPEICNVHARKSCGKLRG